MQRILKSAWPFVLFLAIALGSVIVSCATAGGATDADRARRPGRVTINTGLDEAGRVFLSRAFASVESVIAIERSDRSKRIELGTPDWSYDQVTTELVFLKKLPWADATFHIEGRPEVPARFALRDLEGSADDILVILDGRIGIRGLDYSWNDSTASIVFREGIDLEAASYFVQYGTSYGASSIGDWKPEEGDKIAYLMAERNGRAMRRMIDSMEEDWFLEKVEGGTPRLVRRQISAAERERLAAWPAVVYKNRMGSSDEAVGKEVGFDARMPRKVERGSGGGFYESLGATIQESVVGGKLRLALGILYVDDAGGGPGGDSLYVDLYASPPALADEAGADFIVSREILDLGLPVERIVAWGIQGRPEAEPAAVEMASYKWRDGDVGFGTSADASRTDDVEALIRAIVAFRKAGAKGSSAKSEENSMAILGGPIS